jgi:hypothetical protein
MLFNDIPDNDIAHEAMHSIGLHHTFGITAEADMPYLYKYKATENIMDYSHLDGNNKYSTWKWQWEILRRNRLVVDEIA